MRKDPATGALIPTANFLEAQMQKLPEMSAPGMPCYKVHYTVNP